LLTALEAEHHDRYIATARAGGIDIVFFGTTDSEMWLWKDRGRSVWDQVLVPRKAADFGSQGTHPESLLWRMRNGELAGYQAKVVVLQAAGIGDNTILPDQRAEYVADYSAILAEVRARQPQAKILIFGAFPRGRSGREAWRQIAQSNAAVLAPLVDNKTVFYLDIGDRFFLPDGSHNQEMWTLSPASPGIKEPAFKVWAEVLVQWIDSNAAAPAAPPPAAAR
jgi:hypothetical protein